MQKRATPAFMQKRVTPAFAQKRAAQASRRPKPESLSALRLPTAQACQSTSPPNLAEVSGALPAKIRLAYAQDLRPSRR
jgi:hypothetical protein